MKKETKSEPKGAQPITIESLDQLQKMVDAPLYGYIAIDGQPIKITCRRVEGSVEEQIRCLLRKAQPPPNKVAGKDDYDYGNPKFIAEQEHNREVGRNFRVYYGWPILAAQRPGLTDPEQIHQFVVGAIKSQNILDFVSQLIQGEGIGLVERVNFPSTAGSES